jgi:predicted transposase/invertase (TIGR01784 family)
VRTGIDPTVDYAFKRVFSKENEALLVHFLNAVLEPPHEHRIVSIDVLATVNDRHVEDDKLTVVDLKVRDSAGRRIIIEMQLAVTRAFRERILYYACRDYAGQLHDGDDFTLLMPTIVICIVSRQLFSRDKPHHFRFRLTAEGCSESFTDRLEIHTIELGKFVAAENELPTPLDQWLFFLKNGDELDVQNLPQGLDAPQVRRAVEVLDMISQSELDREKYEQDFKRRKDMLNRDKLLVEYESQVARAEGRQAGELIGQIRTLSQILGDSVPALEELESLPLERLTELAAEIQRRARERGLPV